MACIPLPKAAVPTLPSPLSVDPPAVSLEFQAGLCCKLLSLPPASIAIDLPPGVINAAAIALINQNLAAIQTFLDSLPLDCPKE